jgi:hypothetical protein
MREATERSQARARAEWALRQDFEHAQKQKVEEQRGLCVVLRQIQVLGRKAGKSQNSKIVEHGLVN